MKTGLSLRLSAVAQWYVSSCILVISPKLKIYDEKKKAMEYKLDGEGGMVPGHSMRTYSVAFDQSNPNIVLTGGWDERTVIWDLREETPIRSMFGTYICGDAIDLFDDIVLTASYREDD